MSMTTKASVVLCISSLAMHTACDGGGCLTTEQTGPGLTGAATYVLGDGSRMDADLDQGGYAETTAGTITINVTFVDAWSRKRSIALHVRDVAVGTYDLAGIGDACMPRMTGGENVCAPLTGTIEIRALDEDCYWHESGVGSCAETMDFTIQAASSWEGTQLTVDGEMLTNGAWVDSDDC